ncbi:nuclear transport factor 2 family protein [Parafrankia sp. EUN1f]|uniref:nuclear transport factor 2 family protein n=1 Tax=Parafrankia sp. EUN1f TaxID=102897 RepID=UPI0001C43A10|nr:nuclear transport factor 2 family protein [Parafrankia sp. EUN1f]EFC85241.1 hypothetical protein FrEUN1fDRAFT_1694 [Parafrankia sp. EUN1f]
MSDLQDVETVLARVALAEGDHRGECLQVHFQSIPVVEVDGPVAHAWTDGFTVRLEPAGDFVITSVVRLEDELIRAGADGWAFARRIPIPLLPPAAPQAGQPATEGDGRDGGDHHE